MLTEEQVLAALAFVKDGDEWVEDLDKPNLEGNWHKESLVACIVRAQERLGIRRVWVEDGMLACAIAPDKATLDTGATLERWCSELSSEHGEAGSAVFFKGAAEPERDADGNVLFYLWTD